MAAASVKCYFDIVCPNSWMAIQALTARSHLFGELHFEPVCDFKIGILHNSNIWNQRRKVHNSRIWKKKNEVDEPLQQSEGFLRRIDERGKNVLILENFPQPPEDWKQIYRTAVSRGSIIPQLYLISIKQKFPDLYLKAINHIGNRLWVSKLPVHYGCHMSTVSRELGISFKNSEDIVARLSTPENRHILHNNCREAVELKLTEAPGIIATLDGGEVVKYDHIGHLLSIYNNFPNHHINEQDRLRN
ncbi:unnamed protein product [Caenorhabditis bovis]|uniref:DSBA-like thioredoxin domain-containing protein n=1 Tax=Caenorhabditis bovis TaxID=2654633 RepID=A0A8S1EQ27_9PELO|nr:unnamed protein product [Caenorhabditis bovis]